MILSDSDGFEPRVDGFGIGIEKVIVKLIGTTLYLLKITFDRIAITMNFMAKVHPEFEQTGL